MSSHTTKVDTTDLVDAAGQAGLEALAELLKTGGHIEGREVAILGSPGLGNSSQERRGNYGELHSGVWWTVFRSFFECC